MARKYAFVLIILLMLSACSAIEAPASPVIDEPTPPVMADSFFYGRAYIDANGNGQIDEDDPPLQGAIFSVSDAAGNNGGDLTDSQGSAMAWWPSGTEYPVTLRMDPPKDSGYVIIGESEIVLPAYQTSADFLFALPE
jgi:hypothetical protein